MRQHLTRLAAAIIALGLMTGPTRMAASPAPELPNKAGSVKFAVIGDNGTGDRAQYELAEQMVRAYAPVRARSPGGRSNRPAQGGVRRVRQPSAGRD